MDEYYENINEIKKIENINFKNIENNIGIFKDLKLNFKLKDIKCKSIDEIYIEIIIALIENKIKEYQYSLNIIKQLDLESIDITQTMFNKFKIKIDNKETQINKYFILEYKDLYDNIKINFYFLILKYIFKSSSYIYQINFFLNTRIFLIKLINTNNISFFHDSYFADNNKEKLSYIFGRLTDLKYYKYKINKIKENKNQIRENNFKQFDNKTNLKSSNNSNSYFRSISAISNLTINDKNKKDFCNYNSNENQNSSNTINIKNIYINEKKSNIFYISSKSKKDLLMNQVDEDNESEKNKENKKANIKKYTIFEFEKIIGKHNDYMRNNNEQNCVKSKLTAEFIIEINNGFISGGTNNYLYKYNKSFIIIDKKKLDWIYNVIEVKDKNEKRLNKYHVFASSKDKIYIFNNHKDKFGMHRFFETYSLFLINIDFNNFLSCSKDKIVSIKNLCSNLKKYEQNSMKENILLKSAIKISDSLYIFKSNKVALKGKDSLMFYNFSSNREIISNIKEEYSFTFSSNGLILISKKANKDKSNTMVKILLCGCKKYLKRKKNGILLLMNFNLNDKKNVNNVDIMVEHYFYDTKNFEVYCFCSLSIINKMKITEDKISKIDTDYFLVGGFEKDKNIGIIKLYKIIYDNEITNKIEYIQDVDNDNNLIIKEPISCIIQVESDGKILVTSWDGNVYLFKSPCIEYYLHYDKQAKESISFKDFFK